MFAKFVVFTAFLPACLVKKVVTVIREAPPTAPTPLVAERSPKANIDGVRGPEIVLKPAVKDENDLPPDLGTSGGVTLEVLQGIGLKSLEDDHHRVRGQNEINLIPGLVLRVDQNAAKVIGS